MDQLFKVHKLNDLGMTKAIGIAKAYDMLLETVGELMGTPSSGSTRELSLVRTHLELASFYTKKAMAMQVQNQQLD